MNYQQYRDLYFTKPPPEQRFNVRGIQGATLFFAAYDAAIDYYTRVLGPPAYVEDVGTKGWCVGNTWLTLLQGQNGTPQNVELQIVTATPQEAERMHAAFLDAGGTGEPPSDQLMYEPIRYCPLRDPFGTDILIYSPLG